MTNALSAEQLKELTILMADALIATCDDKKEIKGLPFALGLLKYVLEHPSERGWQSLASWSGHKFIVTAVGERGGSFLGTHDTFYDE